MIEYIREWGRGDKSPFQKITNSWSGRAHPRRWDFLSSWVWAGRRDSLLETKVSREGQQCLRGNGQMLITRWPGRTPLVVGRVALRDPVQSGNKGAASPLFSPSDCIGAAIPVQSWGKVRNPNWGTFNKVSDHSSPQGLKSWKRGKVCKTIAHLGD